MVDRLAVVCRVGGDAGDLALDLPEQGRHLTGIIGSIVGQHAGDDLAGVGVHGPSRQAFQTETPCLRTSSCSWSAIPSPATCGTAV
jgi:hypothetical protein